MHVIGIDLDNTLIDYTEAWPAGLAALGVEAPPEARISKRALRDWLRTQPEGEAHWQRLQAQVYGPGMEHARLAPGAEEFLAACTAEEVPVFLVSHKTRFAAAAPDGPDLRVAARTWLERAGILGGQGLLREECLFFEDTREEKIARIAGLCCTHFIDDLTETFEEPAFPARIEKIWYCPGETSVAGTSWQPMHSFQDIARYFEMRWESEERELILRVSRGAGCESSASPGRNSRGWIATREGGQRVFAKRYRHHHAHRRMETEFNAFTLVHARLPGWVPRALLRDDAAAIAVYDCIDGEPAVAEVRPEDIDACADFAAALAQFRPEETPWMAPAAEACFALGRVADAVLARIQALQAVPHDLLQQYLREELLPLLNTLRGRAGEGFEPLPASARVLSPSDFGLHNAMRRSDGRLVFIDFEYFGWDDPAKLVCDFVLHPAMPLDDSFRRRFVRRLLPRLPDSGLVNRLPLAYPLFGLKWCTILLNDFLPQHRARRRFAGDRRGQECAFAEQLARARAMSGRVREGLNGFPYA